MMRLVIPVAIVAATLCAAGPARAQDIDCGGSRWSGGRPAINVRHIFCGEIRGRPDGYHSEAIAPTPFVRGVVSRVPVGDGIYNATVLFADGRSKFSTFYPRACTPAQIMTSIRYAVAQPRTAKPGGWGFIGPSAPDGPAAAGSPDAFCRGDDGRPFTIRFALLSRGDVNTAFPDPSS